MRNPVRLIKKPALLLALLLVAIAPALAKENSIAVGGRDRTYILVRPAVLARTKPVPLVVVLHGGFGTGAQAEKSYRWDETAAAHDFVVVYPDGVRRSWNAGGGCCGTGASDAVDDVGFLDALIVKISADENIDPARIYLTGISNGAAMSYRYACDGRHAVAAIGSVAGTLPGGCPHPRPVSVMEIHGLQDRNIPFAGGVGPKGVTKVDWPGVQATLDIFRHTDGCAPTTTSRSGAVERSDSLCGSRAVSLITIADAGHQWPGSADRPVIRALLGLDAPSTALDATTTLWNFFDAHPIVATGR